MRYLWGEALHIKCMHSSVLDITEHTCKHISIAHQHKYNLNQNAEISTNYSLSFLKIL